MPEAESNEPDGPEELTPAAEAIGKIEQHSEGMLVLLAVGGTRARCAAHAGPGLMPPLICRPARTSAAYAVSASKATWATLA